jgi:hypothetical protein
MIVVSTFLASTAEAKTKTSKIVTLRDPGSCATYKGKAHKFRLLINAPGDILSLSLGKSKTIFLEDAAGVRVPDAKNTTNAAWGPGLLIGPYYLSVNPDTSGPVRFQYCYSADH